MRYSIFYIAAAWIAIELFTRLWAQKQWKERSSSYWVAVTVMYLILLMVITADIITELFTPNGMQLLDVILEAILLCAMVAQCKLAAVRLIHILRAQKSLNAATSETTN